MEGQTMKMFCPLTISNKDKSITVPFLIDGGSQLPMILDEEDVLALGLTVRCLDHAIMADGSSTERRWYEPVEVSIEMADGSVGLCIVHPCCMVRKECVHVPSELTLAQRIVGCPTLSGLAIKQDCLSHRLTRSMRRM